MPAAACVHIAHDKVTSWFIGHRKALLPAICQLMYHGDDQWDVTDVTRGTATVHTIPILQQQLIFSTSLANHECPFNVDD